MKVVMGADAIRFPLTGIGRYAYELGSRLSACPQLDEVRFFRAGKFLQQIPMRPGQVECARGMNRLKSLVGRSATAVRAFQRFEERLQLRQLSTVAHFIYHGPNYYLPPHPGPCVSTFHDLSVFHWAKCHPVARVRHLQRELPRILKRASVLVTDSVYTRDEVASFFGWPTNRIVVAPLAASQAYRPMSVIELAPLLARWDLRFKSYTLFVGTLDPRKNIDLLLDVYERMPQALRLRMPLVVIGFEGWKSQRTLQRLRRGQSAGWARYSGFVDEAVLPALYAGARVFVYPSRYEGFGLPVVEAMAAGVPVISSNAASLPEVTGGNAFAVLLSPDDDAGFEEAMRRAFDDDEWCDAASKKSLARASTFSWDSTLLATLDAYVLALES